MGHRANLVVITERGRELYYSHWGASTLDRTLFWGPDVATQYARQHTSFDDAIELLDEVWGEGGAVIDHVQRTLLWFGGEDVLFDVPLRRVHQSMMAEMWPGWALHWAFEGVAEIADRLGVVRDTLVSWQPDVADPTWVFRRADDPAWISTSVSCSFRGECRFFATDGNLPDVLALGRPLLDRLLNEPGPSSFDWSSRTTEFPTGGVHVDHDHRSLAFWHAADAPGVLARNEARFSGWSVTSWRDEYEAHLRAAPGLTFPPRDVAELRASLVRHLLAPSDEPSLPSLDARARLLGEAATVQSS